MDVKRRERETKGTREEDSLDGLEQRARETAKSLISCSKSLRRRDSRLFCFLHALGWRSMVMFPLQMLLVHWQMLPCPWREHLYINCTIFHSDTKTLLIILILFIHMKRNNLDREKCIGFSNRVYSNILTLCITVERKRPVDHQARQLNAQPR